MKTTLSAIALTAFLLCFISASATVDVLINTGATWKYLDNGSNQGTAWRSPSFNDASWSSGPSQLGYGDGDEATVVSYGSNALNKYITTYFRKTITVTGASGYTSITMQVKRDDGIVVFINGTERYRNNISNGNISSKTKASGDASDDGNSWISVSLPLNSLINGTNVIAVEIHQSFKNSPDISFDMILSGDDNCAIPSGRTTSSISSSSATLSWISVPGAASYDIQYRVVGALSWNPSTNTSSTSMGLSGLNSSTDYEWQIRTNCSGVNQSAYSPSVLFSTLAPGPCNTPGNISIGAVTSTSAMISWAGVSGAINYSIQYRTIGAAGWNSASTASPSITLSNLTTAKTYEVQLAANCSGGSSAFSASVSFTTPLASSIISRSAYLQVVTPASFRVRWRTTAATNSQVRFGTTMSYGNVVSDASTTTEHELLISGLTANTKYYYTFGSSTQDLQGDQNFYCYTSPATGSNSPFRVWAIGDFGNNSSGQIATRNAMNTYCAGNLPRLWLWMGDNAYSSGLDAEFTSNVFNVYPAQMRNMALYPCLGNHDYANSGYQSAAAMGTSFPYFNMFTCPAAGEAGGVNSNTEKYYSFNYGNVHFIVLDSYGASNTPGSLMYNWLNNDLLANTQRFTVVAWHHPPYSHGTHNSDSEVELVDMRTNIVPLLESYKVDLVLNGHSHTYERTFLIKNHYGVASTFNNSMKVDGSNGFSPYYLKSTANHFEGTVYCVCGVSGQGGSVSTLGTWPHDAMSQYSRALFGSMVIDFSGDTLDAKFLSSAGAIYDRFKIVKSGTNRLGSSTIITGTPENKLEAFPNPFSEELNIRFELETESPVTIEVFDLPGKKVYSSDGKLNGVQQAGLYELQLNKAELGNTRGMLIVKVIAGGKMMQTLVEIIN